MKLSPIVIKLRSASTRFENRIAGAAELELAMNHTLKKDMAFVIQLDESVPANNYDNTINQKITERFAVIVALTNASSDKERTGVISHDMIHDVRAEIWSGILGWDNPAHNSEGIISYAGGKLLDISRAYLWYQFEFLAPIRIDDDDGVDNGVSELPDFLEIYSQWEQSPSANLPIMEGLDVKLFDPDMTSIVDLTVNADDGAYNRGFGSGFYQWKG